MNLGSLWLLCNRVQLLNKGQQELFYSLQGSPFIQVVKQIIVFKVFQQDIDRRGLAMYLE